MALRWGRLRLPRSGLSDSKLTPHSTRGSIGPFVRLPVEMCADHDATTQAIGDLIPSAYPYGAQIAKHVFLLCFDEIAELAEMEATRRLCVSFLPSL